MQSCFPYISNQIHVYLRRLKANYGNVIIGNISSGARRDARPCVSTIIYPSFSKFRTILFLFHIANITDLL